MAKKNQIVKNTPCEYYVKKETLQFAHHHTDQTYLSYSIYSTAPRGVLERSKTEPDYTTQLIFVTFCAVFLGGFLAAVNILVGVNPALSGLLGAAVVSGLLYVLVVVDNQESKNTPVFRLKEQEPAQQLANLLNLQTTQKLSKEQKTVLKQLQKTARTNMAHLQYETITKEQVQTAKQKAAELRNAKRTHQKILEEYGKYRCDLTLILAHPLLLDPLCETTNAFETALVATQDEINFDQNYIKQVQNLQQAWVKAVNYAKNTKTNTLDEPTKTTLEKTQKLLNMAQNSASSAQTAQNYYLKAVHLLQTTRLNVNAEKIVKEITTQTRPQIAAT